MGKEVISAEKFLNLPKVKLSMQLINHTIGEGLAFVEGNKWKDRRKIVSKAFNFDFLKSLIPLITEICDENFAKLAEKLNDKNDT